MKFLLLFAIVLSGCGQDERLSGPTGRPARDTMMTRMPGHPPDYEDQAGPAPLQPPTYVPPTCDQASAEKPMMFMPRPGQLPLPKHYWERAEITQSGVLHRAFATQRECEVAPTSYSMSLISVCKCTER